MCIECYSSQARITPLLKPVECLKQHTQYICGTCGRCICIEKDAKRGLQRWHFPFKTLEIAKLYLRTADYTMKKACGIYEMTSSNGRVFYKIFASQEDLKAYLEKNKTKGCEQMAPLFSAAPYQEFPNTKVRRLTEAEIANYLSQRG